MKKARRKMVIKKYAKKNGKKTLAKKQYYSWDVYKYNRPIETVDLDIFIKNSYETII